MAKINDFKRDFPGLYEHRSTLRSAANPYARLWQEVEQQLNRAQGIVVEYLTKCEAGGFDRKASRYRIDRSARRIPAFLQAASAMVREIGLEKMLEGFVEKTYQEEVGSPFRRIRPGSGHSSTPVRAGLQPALPEVIAKAKRLIDEFGYKWSYMVRDVADGKPVSERQQLWVESRLEMETKRRLITAGGVG
jgi:hypothetical protein